MRVEFIYKKKGDADIFLHVETLTRFTRWYLITTKDGEEILVDSRKVHRMTIYNREWEDEEE